jgi:hypothetical protein
METCKAHIDLSTPRRSERVRAGFQPHWRTVYVYKCSECGAFRRVYANAYRGPHPEPGTGAIVCGATIPTNHPRSAAECEHEHMMTREGLI